MQPARAVLGIRTLAICAKLVTSERQTPAPRPLGSLPDLNCNAIRIPVVESIAQNIEPVHRVRFRDSNFLRGFHAGWVSQLALKVPIIYPPSRALMREGMRVIEVEVVNDIGIGEWCH